MKNHENEEIPIAKRFRPENLSREVREFGLFVSLLGDRFWGLLHCIFSAFLGLKNRLMVSLGLVKCESVSLLMSRKNSWFTERLNIGAVTGVVLALVIFVPQVESFSLERKMSQKLTHGGEAEPLSGGVLFQSNTVSTAVQSGERRAEIVEYTIQPGDTLFGIGKRFNVTAESLAYVNELSNENYLKPGEKIKIPPVSGVIHDVEAGETISSIAQEWGVSAQSIVDANWLDEPYLLAVGQELVVPKAEMPSRVAGTTSPSTSTPTSAVHSQPGLHLVSVAPAATGNISLPCQGRLTQYFSWYHPAVDVAASCGTPISASDSGKIIFAGWWQGGGGYSVMIDHGNGYVTKYAHLQGFARRSGFVSKGEVIGYMGATGRAYGCHTHFIVQRNGRAVNPLNVIR